jgi:hypothetical protein
MSRIVLSRSNGIKYPRESSPLHHPGCWDPDEGYMCKIGHRGRKHSLCRKLEQRIYAPPSNITHSTTLTCMQCTRHKSRTSRPDAPTTIATFESTEEHIPSSLSARLAEKASQSHPLIYTRTRHPLATCLPPLRGPSPLSTSSQQKVHTCRDPWVVSAARCAALRSRRLSSRARSACFRIACAERRPLRW